MCPYRTKDCIFRHSSILVLPCFRILRVLAKVLLNLCTPQDRRSRPHRRRSFTLVESSHSALHNHGHLHSPSPFPVSDICLSYPLLSHDRRLPLLSDSASAPVHVPYSTSTALEAGHLCFLSCFCAFARPPLWILDALRDHLNRVGLGSSLRVAATPLSSGPASAFVNSRGLDLLYYLSVASFPDAQPRYTAIGLIGCLCVPSISLTLSPSLPFSASQLLGISASHHTFVASPL